MTTDQQGGITYTFPNLDSVPGQHADARSSTSAT